MVLLQYFFWHYLTAPKSILRLIENYAIGTWHQFLISRHFATLFSPWHQLLPSQLENENLSLGLKIMNPVIDGYVRLLAACIRLSIIIAGLAVIVVRSAAFLVLLVVWLAWPVIAVAFIAEGVGYF